MLDGSFCVDSSPHRNLLAASLQSAEDDGRFLEDALSTMILSMVAMSIDHYLKGKRNHVDAGKQGFDP
jgi:hypothetical protein